MLVYFCRHGQTNDNLRGIIQGHKDCPLNDHGRRESKRLRDALKDVKFDAAYTSSLSRAGETAQIVVQAHQNVPLYSHPALKERCLGSMEGRTRKKGEKAPADAEPTKALSKRIFDWLTRLLEKYRQPDGSEVDSPTLLVVSHGAWLGALLNILLHKPISFPCAEGVDLRRNCYNTSIMKVRFWPEGDQWKGEILSWGDDKHLDELLEQQLGVVDDVK